MKKIRRRIKSGFYKGFVDEEALRRKAEREAKKASKPKTNLLKALFEIMVALLRIVGYFVLFLLSSIGLTALINPEMRFIFISLIGF